MRIAIVNDNKAHVLVLKHVISTSSSHEIAWIAEDGSDAVTKAEHDTPDLILMDLIMPNVDGVESTRQIMERTPCAILIVTASVDTNAAQVFEAMGAGALDAVNTPILGADHRGKDADTLLNKIDTVARLIQVRGTNGRPQPAAHLAEEAAVPPPPLVVFGASTGGPGVLAQILSRLPKDLDAPMIVVQHVDQQFSASFASWLDEQTSLKVRIANDGDRPEPGTVLVAGTSDHLILMHKGVLSYTGEPDEHVYRPSVDVFLASAAEHWPGEIAAVLLTGMGRDGALGMLALHKRGAYTIAQDETSCAVYGMPKAAVDLGAIAETLPPEEIAAAIMRFLVKHRQVRAGAG